MKIREHCTSATSAPREREGKGEGETSGDSSEKVSEGRIENCRCNDTIIIMMLMVILVLVSINALPTFSSRVKKFLYKREFRCLYRVSCCRSHYQLVEAEEPQNIIEVFQNKIEELQKEIARRKTQYACVWRDAPLYADWRKDHFRVVNVTLDAATAHPALSLSEDGRQVIWQEIQQDLPTSTQRFDSLPCVLGQQGLSMGRHYWEVEVWGTHSWDLGICRDNATRKGRVTTSPQNGFWAIRLYDGEYWALTSPETHLTLREIPVVVGIFLDYEDGDISFYNMTDGSRIFSFPKRAFYGVLRPFFRLWSSDSGSLTICASRREQNDAIIGMEPIHEK